MQQYPTPGSLETSGQSYVSFPTQGLALLSQSHVALGEQSPDQMIQEGQKALVKGAVWRENDNDREAARSEEMILLWGVVPPLLSNGGGVDGWMDGW